MKYSYKNVFNSCISCYLPSSTLELTDVVTFENCHKLILRAGVTLEFTKEDVPELTDVATFENCHKLWLIAGVTFELTEEFTSELLDVVTLENRNEIGVAVCVTYWWVVDVYPHCASTEEETIYNHFISRFKPQFNYCGSYFYIMQACLLSEYVSIWNVGFLKLISYKWQKHI